MNTIIYFIISALDIYLWLIIAGVVMSWLVVFDVLNMRNKWVHKIYTVINQLTEPGMELLRRVIPPIGGVDLTPMVMMFGIYFIQGVLYGLIR